MENRKKSSLLLNLLIIGLLLVSFFGIFIPLYLDRNSLLILASYLIIPTLFALGFYLLKRNPSVRTIVGETNIKLYNILYILFYSLSVSLLFIFSLRNIFYYLSISILALIVFLEIMRLDITIKNRNIILSQISLLVVNLIYSVTLKYDYFIGRMDLSFHIGVLNNLINNDVISSMFGVYEPFPGWYIFNDVFVKLSGIEIPIQKTVFLLSGIVYCVMMVCIFILCKLVTNNLKLSLLTTLLIGIFPDFVFIGMYSIPRSTAIIFEILLLILLLKSYNNKSIGVGIFLTFIILIFHTVTIIFLMVIVVSIIAAMRYFGVKYDNNLNYKYMVVSGIMILLYWVFNAEALYARIIGSLSTLANSSFYNLSGDVSKFSLGTSTYNEVFNYIQYAILFFFIVIGNLYILRDERMGAFTKGFAILGLLYVALSFPGFVSVISGLSGNLNLTRFSEQTFIFTNIAAAVGLFYLYRRPSRLIKVILSVCVLALVLFSASNDFVASDNPLVKRDFYTFYFTNVEVSSFKYVSSNSVGEIYTDFVTTRFISEQELSGNVSTLEYFPVDNLILTTSKNDLILIRTSEAANRPLHLLSSPDGVYIDDPSVASLLEYFYYDARFQSSLSRSNLIFNSNDVMTFN